MKLYSRPSCSPARGWRVVCETEKPKVLGCAAKRRFRSVDLPVPLGPERTIGRWSFVADASREEGSVR